jgi:repressor LexA
MSERDELTDRQKEVLDYIQESISGRGYPPTLREIGERMGIRSTNGVNDHLKALEKKGYLAREDLKSRALRPLKFPAAGSVNSRPAALAGHGLTALPANIGEDVIEVPVIGRVAAGAPLLAVENIEDTVKVDRFFLGGYAPGAAAREVFALRVKGESMIEDGIFDGDFIFVKKSLSAERGDIVVALIDDEATVKRYYPEGDVIRFQPANAAMQPIIVRRRDFKSVNLIGIVVGVYRKIR